MIAFVCPATVFQPVAKRGPREAVLGQSDLLPMPDDPVELRRVGNPTPGSSTAALYAVGRNHCPSDCAGSGCDVFAHRKHAAHKADAKSLWMSAKRRTGVSMNWLPSLTHEGR